MINAYPMNRCETSVVEEQSICKGVIVKLMTDVAR